MQRATLYARTIEQPNRNTEYNGHLCGKAISHSGKYEYNRSGKIVSCAYCNKQRWYHEWSFIENLKEPNKSTQCGRPNTKLCSHATYYGIAGYRNTCPIAGCSGDYTTPAAIKLSNFDFESLGITKNSKIHSISVNWNHRCRGVNVGNGRETTNSPPNFNGFNYYPDRTVVESYLAYGDEKLATLHGFNGLKVENPPNSDSFKGVGVATAKNLDASKVVSPDFALYIQYGQNLSTNPGNLYVSDIVITIEYDNGEPIITSPSNDRELYTNSSTECNCYSKIIHEVNAGWLFLNTNIGDVFDSKPLTVEFDTSYCPEGVSVKDLVPNNPQNKIFEIEDHSGEEGDKCLHYYIKEYPEKRAEVWFKAKKYSAPTISVKNVFYKDVKYNDEWQLFDPNTSYITAKNGCANSIKIWIDSTNKDPDVVFNCLYPSEPNMLMFDSNGEESSVFQKQFYDKMQELNCGKYNLYVKIDDNPNLIVLQTQVSASDFIFEIQDSDIGDWNQNRDDDQYKTILITRTDNLNIKYVDIEVHDESHIHPLSDRDSVQTYTSIEKGDIIEHQVSKYYAGTFNIKVVDKTNTCEQKEYSKNFTVIPSHKQHYDILFVRGEDSTSFDYDYLVAWEADKLQKPIKAISTEIGATMDDIKICTENSHTALSETGLFSFTVTNVGDHGNIKNLQLELNVKYIDEDGAHVTTDEWELPEGMLYKNRLINDFYAYNKTIRDNVYIKIDRDERNKSDAENVYIYINEIQEDESIEVFVPFESKNPKHAYIEFLIFENPQKLYWKNCRTPITNNPIGFDNLIKISVIDSIATELSIDGETDLLNPNSDISECPIEYYSTDLTYNIKNIDSSNFKEIEGSGKAKTIIDNSLQMVPYRYKYKDQVINIADEDWVNGVYKPSYDLIFYRKEFEKEIDLSNQLMKAHLRFPNNEETIISKRTDNNGNIIFPVSIPISIQEKMNLKQILSNYVYIEYAGDSIYNYSYLSVNDSSYPPQEAVLPKKTKIEYIGVTNSNYIDGNIPKDAEVTLKYRIESDGELLNQKSINVYMKDNNNDYKLNTITVSSESHNEFVHNKKISEYQNKTDTQILESYEDANYIPNNIIHITTKCTRVIDGDTIEVRDLGIVRLVGVNTPEIGMLGADTSKYVLQKLCLNKNMSLRIDMKKSKDKYNRILAVVIVNGKNINEVMLREGLAEIMFIRPSSFNPYSWGTNNETYGSNVQITVINPKKQILNDLLSSLQLVYNGDSLNSSYNPKNIEVSNTKIPTKIEYVDNWRSYNGGDIAYIKVSLKGIEKSLDNYIEFYADLEDAGSSDQLCVSYKMYDLEKPERFVTKFSTDDERLIQNQIKKDIYCGYDTDIKLYSKINMDTIQQTFINIIYLNVLNGFKPNKDVKVDIDLSQVLETYKGDYKFISIETEDGDYALYEGKNENENEVRVVSWLIGNMGSYQQTKATIKIKANEIGLSDIKVTISDYLHNSDEDITVGEKQCEECDD